MTVLNRERLDSTTSGEGAAAHPGRARARRSIIGITVAAMVGSMVSVVSSTADPALAAAQPAVPKLTWTACQEIFQCATAKVPLDYRNPRGKTVDLALLKLPASNPAKRVGSLFLNFGGPGSSGTSRLAERAKTVFSDEQRASFDLIGYDQRGIGKSQPAMNCFASAEEQQKFFGAFPDMPAYGKAAEDKYFGQSKEIGKQCAARAKAIAPYMSSANHARDLDLLRQAVGDKGLNFWGFSYGTVLGATYANMFPTKARAIILDGSLDFVGNSTGHGNDAQTKPVDVRQDVAGGAQATFKEFLRLCALAGEKCAFSKGGDLPAKWAKLIERTKKQPIVIKGSDGKDASYDYPTMISSVYYALYKPMTSYESTATLLQKLYDAMGTSTTRRQLVPAAKVDKPYTSNSSDSYWGVQCADARVPKNIEDYRRLGTSEDKRVPGFGRFAVFTMTACASWSVKPIGTYNGPWNKSKAPILVVNTSYDPATPVEGATEGVKQLKNAKLLTVKGAGHTSMYSPKSTCATTAETNYLVTGKLPTVATCAVDQAPWGLPANS